MSSTVPLPSSTTFVAMTHNVWGDHHAAEREPALSALYALRAPDLLATQELRAWSRDAIDAAMPHHARVVDDFPGWEAQSNLWWNTELFEEVEHGAEDVGILDTNARLFWVRLRSRTTPDSTLVFATAHLTWSGHTAEISTGVNQRTPQAERVVAELERIAGDGPCIFTVDINDIAGPLWAFGNGGYLDTFTALARHSPVTHPVVPDPFAEKPGTRLSPIQSPPKAIDWIFVRGGIDVRASEAVEYFRYGMAASDHLPVAATLRLSGALRVTADAVA